MSAFQRVVSTLTRLWDFGFYRLFAPTALLFFVVIMLSYLANILLLPPRVYLTGGRTTSVIEECLSNPLISQNGIIGFDYEARAHGRSDYLPINSCDGNRIGGHPVTVVYSDVAEAGVIVDGTPTLWNVYTGMYGGTAGSLLIASVLGGVIISIYRLGKFVSFSWTAFDLACERAQISIGSPWERLSKFTELLTDLSFLLLVLTSFLLFIYAAFKGLLYLQHGEFIFSILAVTVLVVFWSSLPTKLAAFAWKAYKSRLVAIVRNSVAAVLMINSIRAVLHLQDVLDITSFDSIETLCVDILRAAIGLDPLQ